MNIQATKLSLIEWLISLQDESLLEKLEQFRSKTKKTSSEKIKPMSLDAFYSKIENSEKAFKNGKVISQDELRKEIKSWAKR